MALHTHTPRQKKEIRKKRKAKKGAAKRRKSSHNTGHTLE